MPLLDNADMFTRVARITVRDAEGGEVTRTLSFPGDLDWSCPPSAVGKFATTQQNRSLTAPPLSLLSPVQADRPEAGLRLFRSRYGGAAARQRSPVRVSSRWSSSIWNVSANWRGSTWKRWTIFPRWDWWPLPVIRPTVSARWPVRRGFRPPAGCPRCRCSI